MGGIPGAIGNAASAVGDKLGDAGRSFWGAAKEGVQDNYIEPWKNAISDMRGAPPSGAPDAATQTPQATAPPEGHSAMRTFFGSAAPPETPAMRLRRAYAQQG